MSAARITSPLDLGTLRNYASVVVVDAAANQFAPGQMRALKTYVQNYGGGLVVAGGEQSYGPGSYARTPFEEMLPVRMDLRGKSISASTALILVIDTSGSMGGGPGGASKMDLAKEAAISAAELLGEYDQIGVVAFEDQPRWAIPPTPGDRPRRRPGSHRRDAARRRNRDLPGRQDGPRGAGAHRRQGQAHHPAHRRRGAARRLPRPDRRR